jgi:hypothetical protein
MRTSRDSKVAPAGERLRQAVTGECRVDCFDPVIDLQPTMPQYRDGQRIPEHRSSDAP